MTLQQDWIAIEVKASLKRAPPKEKENSGNGYLFFAVVLYFVSRLYPGLESDGAARSVSFPKHQKPAVIKIYQDGRKHTPAGFTCHLLHLSSLP